MLELSSHFRERTELAGNHSRRSDHPVSAPPPGDSLTDSSGETPPNLPLSNIGRLAAVPCVRNRCRPKQPHDQRPT